MKNNEIIQNIRSARCPFCNHDKYEMVDIEYGEKLQTVVCECGHCKSKFSFQKEKIESSCPLCKIYKK